MDQLTNQLSVRVWGYIFILLGVLFGIATILLLQGRKGQARIIEGLALIGPCTGRALVEAGYASRGAVCVYLSELEQQGLVRSRALQVTPERLAVRGEVPLKEFRLTTKGWSYATILTK